MVDLSGLYPAPPAQPQNLLSGNPGAILGMVGQVNALQQFQAHRAVGEAYQNALNPDGSVDQLKLAAGLKAPQAALAAPEAIGTMLEQRGKMIANSTTQFGLKQSQNAEMQRLLAGYAQDPDQSDEKMRDFAVTAARAGGDPNDINAMRQELLSQNPKQRAATIGNASRLSMGAGAASTPETVTDPITGQQIRIPHGGFSGGAQAIPTGLSPQRAADTQSYIADQAASAKTLADIRTAEQAYPLLEKMTAPQFGPLSPEFSKVKNGLVSLGWLDPKSPIADADTLRQEVAKKLSQNSLMMPGATRSNEGMAAQYQSNPSLFLSKEANLPLLRDAIGMAKQDAAAPLFAGNANDYQNVKNNHYLTTDPRGFVLHLMDVKTRAALKNDPNAAKIHATGLKAISRGMMPPPIAPNAGQ